MATQVRRRPACALTDAVHSKTVGKWRNTRVFARPGRKGVYFFRDLDVPGKGLVCHKFINRICQLAGIQDLSADVSHVYQL